MGGQSGARHTVRRISGCGAADQHACLGHRPARRAIERDRADHGVSGRGGRPVRSHPVDVETTRTLTSRVRGGPRTSIAAGLLRPTCSSPRDWHRSLVPRLVSVPEVFQRLSQALRVVSTDMSLRSDEEGRCAAGTADLGTDDIIAYPLNIPLLLQVGDELLDIETEFAGI